MTFEIRQTDPGDVPDLQTVLTETELFPAEFLPGMLDAAGKDQVWLTCRADGRAIGLAFAEPEAFTEGTWNMRALAVLPEFHRSGAGRALVQGLEERLRGHGQRLLIVDTSGSETLSVARAFYAAIGYEHEATISDFWSAGDHKVTFRKVL